jgi:hypothetical protein
LASLPLLYTIRSYGHGFGARYDLPLPLTLWVVGAACAIVLSFLVISIAVRANVPVQAHVGGRIDRRVASGLRLVAQLCAVAALILVIVAGIFGDQTPTRNLAPTAIWIAWWVGFSYLSAFVGNVWSLVNPWAAIFDWCTPAVSSAQASQRSKVDWWPEPLGVWPGIALFFVFAWLELIWEGRSDPRQLAWLAIGFSVLTWTGMFIFGRNNWLTHADPFALAFGVLSKFGLIDFRTEQHDIGSTCTVDRKKEGSASTGLDGDRFYRIAPPGTLILRTPGVGLIDNEHISLSLSAFVIVMLSTVTFDGVMATPLWQRVENALYVALPVFGDSRLAIINTIGLVVFCVAFFGVYRLVATSIAHASGNRMTPDAASRGFVLTLVPIAIAYLVAHYLSYFLIQGQLLIRLASDPFGFGWDIFGTARFRPDIGIVGARFVWYTSLIAIVLGHVAAVSLAHIVALRKIEDHRVAIRTQIPMLVLMIGYTMMSLWIIAQPIVE